MGFSRQEYTGVGSHFLLQGIFPTQGSNLHLLGLLTLAGRFFNTSAAREALFNGGGILGSQQRPLCPSPLGGANKLQPPTMLFIQISVKNMLEDWQAPEYYYFLNAAYYSTSGTKTLQPYLH